MCGICGKIAKMEASRLAATMRAMADSIIHRGPDDEGLEIESISGQWNIGLAHRRLSIIDLSQNARQPMSNEDGTLWLVFNGEIYNFQSIRKELLNKGHRFRSESDTEVILHLYEEEGLECVNRLAGMFAFALWDSRKKRLWLCRDRLGIKPLVYLWDRKSLSFASEIKALLADPTVSKEIDFEALGLYLSLNYIPAAWTIFNNVRKLEPGHWLVFENGRLEKHRYWQIQNTDTSRLQPDKFDALQQKLYQLSQQAVERRLIADVPLGAFLSGGIDSSIVVGLMTRCMDRPVQTFSIGYKDLPFYDETQYASVVAKFHKTDHHEFRLSYKDILDAIPDVLDDFDEPFADSSAIPTYIVSRETRKEVTVALSGDGADELFAGYRKYSGEYWHRYYSLLPKKFRESVLKQMFANLPRSRSSKIFEHLRRADKFVQGAHDSQEDRVWAWREIFSRQLANDLLLPEIREQVPLEKARSFTAEGLRGFAADPINRMLHLDVTGSLPDDMLSKVDRMSMRHALEVRVPFLDHELVEFAFTIPGDLKLHRGKRKYILIETFKNLLPPKIQTRPKWGFEVPISTWLKKELKPYVDRYLSDKPIRQQGIFNPSAVKNLIGLHMSGKREMGWQLWTLIVFGHWYDRYFSQS
jgi:asparagine synthase (glutamine-hydrolysing)